MKKSGQKVQTQVYIFATFMRFLFAYIRKNDYLCTQNSKIGMKIKLFLGVLVISTMTVLQSSVYAQAQRDWAGFHVYAADNARLDSLNTKVQVVFYGNSITQIWNEIRPQFFTDNGFTGRGIGGQTSSELLVRMRQDVIDLHPHTVVIMCGVNDIAQNNGPISLEHTMGNIISMCELARANHIRPILCSPLPARSFYWNPSITNAPQQIQVLKELIENYAHKQNILYVDYYSAMVDKDGGLKKGLSEDEVHPNDTGYQIMEPIILKALNK